MVAKTFFLESNTFKAIFISNFSNFMCVDQYHYGDRFDSIVSVDLQKKKRRSPPLWMITNFDHSLHI